MTKKKSLLLWILIAVMALSCFILSACGTSYVITWEYDSAVIESIEVIDANKLPDKAAEGEEIAFKVNCKEGYEVDSVKVNKTTINATEGVYTLTVTTDINVKITAQAKIQGIEVTKNPDKMTYFAGQEFDDTGMEVTLMYATGTTETLNSNDYIVSPAVFEGGEEEFTVSYKDDSSIKDKVAIETVEYLVTVDFDGGSTNTNFINELQNRAGEDKELHNWNVDQKTGVITFSYLELTAPITLPAAETMSKGQNAGDFVFQGWSVAEIGVNDKASYNVKANWFPRLVNLTSISLENRVLDGNLCPVLVLSGTFEAAEEVYMYLYEGNDKIELKNDAAAQSGSRGENFELVLDLTLIDDSKYTNRWMDIRVNAMVGDREESMEVILEDYPEDFIDLGTFISNASFDKTYSYQTYSADIDGSKTALKVVKAEGFDFDSNYSYDISIADKAGKPTLTVSGKVISSATGMTLGIAMDQDGDEKISYGTVANDGSFTVDFDMSSLTADEVTNVYIKLYQEAIADITADTAPIFDKNLLSKNCTSNLYVLDPQVGEILDGILYSDNGATPTNYYVGATEWGELSAYVTTEAASKAYYISDYKTAKLAVKNDTVYLVVSGKYEALTDAEAAEVISSYLPEYIDLMDMTSWGAIILRDSSTDKIIVEAAEGNYSVYLDLSEISVDLTYFSHFGSGDGKNLEVGALDETAKVLMHGEMKYTLSIYGGFGGNVVTVNAIIASTEVEYTEVNLLVEGGEVYYVITGTAGAAFIGDQAAELTVYFDLQHNGSWYCPVDGDHTATVDENGNFTFKIKISDIPTFEGREMTAGASAHFTAHLGSGSTNFECTIGENNTVQVGNVTYTLVKNGNTYDTTGVLVQVN